MDDRNPANSHSGPLLSVRREIHDLENEKRDTARSTPKFHDLAEEITHKSRSLFHQAADQEHAADHDSPDRREREEQYPGDWTKNAEH
jgi:hypothetical protein